jgi:hypothetical protein
MLDPTPELPDDTPIETFWLQRSLNAAETILQPAPCSTFWTGRSLPIPEWRHDAIALYPTKSAELKPLHGAPRRGVVVAPGIDQFEVGSENSAKHSCIIPHDRQAAAPFRPIQGEGAQDNVSAGSDCAVEMTNIGGTIGSIGEEMKRSAVVPQIVSFGWFLGGDIRNHPFDVSPPVAKTPLGRIESGC